MRHWLIRTDAPSIEVDFLRSIVLISSRRQPRIRPHDQLVFISNKARMPTASGEVTDLRHNTSGLDGYVTTIFYRQTRKSDELLELSDLWYSLQAVRNVANPLLHFRRGYRSLTPSDFATLVSGEVFVARTAYFQILAALPGPMQRAFYASELLREHSARPSFARKLANLWTFVADRILSAEEAMRDISASLHALNLSAGFRHAFTSDERLEPIFLDTQIQQFDLLDAARYATTSPAVADADAPRDVVLRALREITSGDLSKIQADFETAFGGAE